MKFTKELLFAILAIILISFGTYKFGYSQAKINDLTVESSQDVLMKKKDKTTKLSELNESLTKQSTQEADKLSNQDIIINNKDEYSKEAEQLKNDIDLQKNEKDNLKSEIDSKNKELSKLEEEIINAKKKPIDLAAGIYTVGENIEPGNYEVSVKDGNGNFIVYRGEGETVANAMLGEADGSVKKYSISVEKDDVIFQTLDTEFKKLD